MFYHLYSPPLPGTINDNIVYRDYGWWGDNINRWTPQYYRPMLADWFVEHNINSNPNNWTEEDILLFLLTFG